LGDGLKSVRRQLLLCPLFRALGVARIDAFLDLEQGGGGGGSRSGERGAFRQG